MKAMKKLTAVILCLLMMSAVCVPAFALTRIEEANVTFTVPQPGDTVEYKELGVDAPDEYSAKIFSVSYYDSETSQYVEQREGDTYIDGAQYRVRIQFTAKDGFGFENTVFYVNGIPCSGNIGQNLVETEFTPGQGGGNGVLIGTNIFAKIAAFFRMIIEYIRFKLSILPPKVY